MTPGSNDDSIDIFRIKIDLLIPFVNENVQILYVILHIKEKGLYFYISPFFQVTTLFLTIKQPLSFNNFSSDNENNHVAFFLQ
eukprot:snap_masked-scaffold_7-processed-gene-7.1-mRNA-1 protein AED:1.00 eAED:1.00 QI:0/0/0/0/1/1/5/0/82